MLVNEEYVDKLLTHAMDTAKKNREKEGFSGDFTPVAIAVGPHGEHGLTALPYQTATEKAVMLAAITVAARDLHALAVVLVRDTREVDLDKFDRYHGLPEEPDFEKRRDRYAEIRASRYGGFMGEIPHELFTDAILVSVKGPMVEPEARFQYYKEGVGNSIIWGEQRIDPRVKVLDLQDWWDASPVN
jgi:hypothetical protein